jgi:hypothetical protein
MLVGILGLKLEDQERVHTIVAFFYKLVVRFILYNLIELRDILSRLVVVVTQYSVQLNCEAGQKVYGYRVKVDEAEQADSWVTSMIVR